MANDQKSQNSKIKIVVGLTIFLLLVIIVVVMVFTAPSNLYRMKIKGLKAGNPEKYAFFPDSFPKSSSDKKYSYLPNILQGTGYLIISFTIQDQDYIQDLYDRYIDNKCIYTYDHANGGKYEWIEEDNLYNYYTADEPYTGKSGYDPFGWVNYEKDSFFTSIDYKIENIKNTEMLLTYEHSSNDPDEEEKGAIIIDDVNCKVYFWADN